MALEGSLKDFGLPDIFQLIYFQRKTGVLTLEGKMDRVRLLFIEGNISGAESKKRTEDNRLGKILLKKGLLKEEDLEAAFEEQRKTGVKLGTIVIRNGLVDNEAIKDIIQAQITETIIQLFGWKQGTYEFAAQEVSPDQDLSFSLDTQHLLMEGLRIVDEWSLIEGKITLGSLFRKCSETPSGLLAEERDILAHVDGENDVCTIIDLSGQDNFEVSKTLLSLMEKGAIEPVVYTPQIAEVERPVVTKTSSNIIQYIPTLVVILSFFLSSAGLVMHKSDDVKRFGTARKISQLNMQIEKFKYEHAAYPSTLEQITQSKDAWGNPYIYKPAEGSFFLSSAGADGVAGTQDDIY